MSCGAASSSRTAGGGGGGGGSGIDGAVAFFGFTATVGNFFVGAFAGAPAEADDAFVGAFAGGFLATCFGVVAFVFAGGFVVFFAGKAPE